MIFCLHLLAHHQEIQEEARESIKKVLSKYDGKWSYDVVSELSFLDQIIEGEKHQTFNAQKNVKGIFFPFD